ncbi:hypothetical protein L3X38_029378 [Prunus dulcis]|uniref:Uncharacterized protein n=1 Tax=Prunus dulcis TaxID=3755 RepID=A0AAD4VSI1_PRUDU|nr:hypothetical protein L3X38_029378 [Prunus dulcis]
MSSNNTTITINAMSIAMMQGCLEVKRFLLGILKIDLLVVLVQMMAVVLGGDNNGGRVRSAVDFGGGGGGASVGWGFGGGKRFGGNGNK